MESRKRNKTPGQSIPARRSFGEGGDYPGFSFSRTSLFPLELYNQSMKEEDKSGAGSPENDFGPTIYFLMGILEKANMFSQHIDTQLNIIVGLSAAIFAFAAANFGRGGANLAFDMLGFFSALSATFALLAIHPPKFMRKRGQTESLMYNKRISEFGSSREYYDALSGTLKSKEAIIGQYASEIYNIYKYYYRPKRKLYKITRNTLLAGIVLSLVFGALSSLGF